MLRQVTREQFVAAPVGGYVIGRTFLVWCASPTLSGTTVWGAPDQSDAREMVGLWEHDHQLRGFDSVLDAQRMRWVDLDCFTVVSGYIRTHLARYPRILRRQAVIVPREPLAGSIVAGAPLLLELGHAWRAFTDENAALAWLERDDVGEVWREVGTLVDDARAQSATLADLRDYLVRNPRAASLDEVSRTLGLSTRSLQRHLRRSGSSFRDEVRRARAEAAARLLAGTELKLEAIANQIGYASLSHFTDAFVEATGQQPQAYRRALRAGE